ncbi:MAG: carboxypeptidase regulatory-like domain-containing protein [Candidatus Omnitrophica bacterium]|nr:carboxypeptidase regulatory-like domain-containing protein [Candidatus Omnitrophota bacterium]
MTKRPQLLSPLVVTIVVAIGCSGGKPQDAAAKPASEAHTQTTVQLAASTADATAPAGGATILGTIRFQGVAPAQEHIAMDADPVCQQQHASPVSLEEVVVNGNGTLKNVFVYVKEGLAGSFPAPTAAVTLDQAGCWYHPHVLGIQVNQPLEILNSDSTLHNVNAKPANNQPFNVAQPVKGMKTTKKFAKPELGVKFKCNVHPWMNAYAAVVEHPFFSVSDDQGGFTIAGLPAGTYVIEAWHEKYGTQTQTVTIAAGETKSMELIYKGQ